MFIQKLLKHLLKPRWELGSRCVWGGCYTLPVWLTHCLWERFKTPNKTSEEDGSSTIHTWGEALLCLYDCHIYFIVSLKKKGHMYTKVICPDNHFVFFFNSLSLPLYSSDPEHPGAQRTALWVLHSRAKQLHWTVTDFPGNGRPTNKGHPHEWINKALMHRCNLAHLQKQQWTKGTFITSSLASLQFAITWTCCTTTLARRYFGWLWSARNLITRPKTEIWVFKCSKRSLVGHSCNTKHLFCPSCYFSKGAISKMPCWVWAWRRQSVKLLLGLLARPQPTAWQTQESPECLELCNSAESHVTHKTFFFLLSWRPVKFAATFSSLAGLMMMNHRLKFPSQKMCNFILWHLSSRNPECSSK